MLAGAGADARSRAKVRPKARSVVLVCTLATQINFSPRLNFNTVSAAATGQFTNCVSPNGKARDLTSAIVFGSSGTASGCSPLPLVIDLGDSTIYWSNETSGSIEAHASTDVSTGRLGLTATLLDGTLAGAHIEAVPAAVLQNGACLLGGVQSLVLPSAVAVITL